MVANKTHVLDQGLLLSPCATNCISSLLQRSKYSYSSTLYHAVLVNYLDSARQRGFRKAQLFAIAPDPKERDDFALSKGDYRPHYKGNKGLCDW